MQLIEDVFSAKRWFDFGISTEDDGRILNQGLIEQKEGFGARASEKLLQVRGKRFQHEKTKRERSFNGMSRTGGKIGMESNSTKYKYD